MELLNLEATRSTPSFHFDPESGVLAIAGESYPENSFEFFAPIFTWLKATLAEVAAFRLEFAISYMNSSSIKCVLDMLDLLEDAGAKGTRVEVAWYYDPENPRALDLAEEFQEEISLPFMIMPLEQEA